MKTLHTMASEDTADSPTSIMKSSSPTASPLQCGQHVNYTAAATGMTCDTDATNSLSSSGRDESKHKTFSRHSRTSINMMHTAAIPQCREAANARERHRMRVLAEGYRRLKLALPGIPADTKLSKLDTLRLAAARIRQLRSQLNVPEDARQSVRDIASEEAENRQPSPSEMSSNFDEQSPVGGSQPPWMLHRGDRRCSLTVSSPGTMTSTPRISSQNHSDHSSSSSARSFTLSDHSAVSSEHRSNLEFSLDSFLAQ